MKGKGWNRTKILVSGGIDIDMREVCIYVRRALSFDSDFLSISLASFFFGQNLYIMGFNLTIQRRWQHFTKSGHFRADFEYPLA